jgi:hypothetical protein
MIVKFYISLTEREINRNLYSYGKNMGLSNSFDIFFKYFNSNSELFKNY